ncbi:MAG: hypothetical protein IBX55_01530 [Methyloprofundus sp.]|nr:hypothetical protein [Methyloprofundus sp.]
MLVKKTMLSAMIIVMLAGCSTAQEVNHNKQVFEEDSKKVDSFFDSSVENVNSVESVVHPWVSTNHIELLDKLDERIANKFVVFNEFEPTSLRDVSIRLQDVIGKRVFIESDVFKAEKSSAGDTGASAIDVVGTVTSEMVSVSGTEDVAADIKISLNHKGSIAGLLDRVARLIDSEWRYEASRDRIVFYKFETRRFIIATTPGSATNTSSFSANIGGNTEFTQNYSVWESLRESVENLLTDEGVFTLSESTGMLTVRDRPDVLERIEQHVRDGNDILSQNILFHVQVFSVVRDVSDNRGVNWNAVFSGFDFAASGVSPRGLTDGMGSVIFDVPSTATGPLQNFIGSQAFIDGLSRFGEASNKTRFSMQTQNNQPAPIKIVRNVGYLKSQQVSTGTGVDGQPLVTLEPGEVEVGVTLQVLPSIQGNKKDMVVQISGKINDLVRITNLDSGTGSIIQVPEVASRDLMNKVWLRSGSTLVLAGMEFTENRNETAGIFSPRTWFLGGSNKSVNKKESLIIIITPRIVDHNLDSNVLSN